MGWVTRPIRVNGPWFGTLLVGSKIRYQLADLRFCEAIGVWCNWQHS